MTFHYNENKSIILKKKQKSLPTSSWINYLVYQYVELLLGKTEPIAAHRNIIQQQDQILKWYLS